MSTATLTRTQTEVRANPLVVAVTAVSLGVYAVCCVVTVVATLMSPGQDGERLRMVSEHERPRDPQIGPQRSTDRPAAKHGSSMSLVRYGGHAGGGRYRGAM